MMNDAEFDEALDRLKKGGLTQQEYLYLAQEEAPSEEDSEDYLDLFSEMGWVDWAGNYTPEGGKAVRDFEAANSLPKSKLYRTVYAGGPPETYEVFR